MAIPKEPRQAMINMMYLVLTALLALNVSAEILNAFDIVNDGIKNSTTIIQGKSSSVLSSLSNMADSTNPQYDPNAVQPYQLALQAQQIADKAFQDLESYKNQLKRKAGLEYNPDTGDSVLTNKRDTHLPTLFLVGPNNDGKGYDIQQIVNKTRQEFIELYPENVQDVKESEITLNAADANVPNTGGAKKDWVEYNFYEVPVIAAITVLSKIQNDIRKTESDFVDDMSKSVTATILEMDKVKATIIPEKSVVTTGETFRANLMVSAYSSAQEPVAYLGSVDESRLNDDGVVEVDGEFEQIPILGDPVQLEDAQNGIIEYERSAGGTGNNKVTGVIGIYNPKKNLTTYYPFSTEYTVTRSMAVVSPTKMNVLYIGVDNPLAISVPGFQPSQVNASISQGTLSKSSGNEYIAKVTSTGTANVRVSVSLEDGSTKSMGAPEFRVKRIPDPKVLFGRSSGPVVSSGEAKAIPGLVPIADNFPFQVNFDIRDFEVMVKKRNNPQLFTEKNRGRVFEPKVKQLIGSLKPGDRLWFDNIRVLAPDGTTRVVSLSFRLI